MTNTIRMIKLWEVNTNTNEKALITIAFTAFEERLLNGIAEQLEFNLKENEKLEKEFIYRWLLTKAKGKK